MSNIQLHCDIKQDYNDIAQYLGAVIEIKQVGHPSYDPIVGVTKTGQLYWSTSLAWDKKYTNSMRPSYNYTRSRTGSEFSSNMTPIIAPRSRPMNATKLVFTVESKCHI